MLVRISRGLIFLLAFWASIAQAQVTISGAVPDSLQIDPFRLTALPNLEVNALSQTAVQTLDITKTNLIMITTGQSNMADVAPSAFSPVNASAIFQLNMYDGKIYPASDPLIGPQYAVGAPLGPGNPALRIADSIITNAYFQRVYIEATAIGNTQVSDWSSGLNSSVIPIAVRRLNAKGIVCGTTNITCVIIWGQGENDCSLGTPQGTYTAALNVVIAAAVAAGFTGHWYIANQSYNGTITCAAVTAGQTATVNGTSVRAGPNADSLVGNVCGSPAVSACRNAGSTVHWSDNGSLSYAALWVTALHNGGF